MNKSTAAENKRTPKPARWVLLFVPLVLVVGGAAVLSLGITPKKLQTWIQETGPNPTGFEARLVFFLVAVVLVSLVMPKTVISITAGAMFGTWVGGVLVALVSLCAAGINYAVARWWIGDRVMEHLNQVENQSNPVLAAIGNLAHEAGYQFHILVRLAPIPSMLINYSMGALRARILPFFTAAAVGVLPQLLWVHGGTIASGDSNSPFRWLSALVSIFAAIIIAVIVPQRVKARIAHG